MMRAIGMRLGTGLAALVLIASGDARAQTTCVLFGDSISAMHSGEDRLDAMLQQKLETFDASSSWTMNNVSQGGEWIGPGTPQTGVATPLFDTTTSGKYFTVVSNHAHADCVFIQYAANDSKVYTPDDFKTKMATLCDRLEDDYPGVSIILATSVFLPPEHAGPYWRDPSWVDGFVQGGSRNDYLAPYFAATRDLATERGYTLADVAVRFEQELAAGNTDLYIGDGDIHPNPDGSEVIADVYFEALLAALGVSPDGGPDDGGPGDGGPDGGGPEDGGPGDGSSDGYAQDGRPLTAGDGDATHAPERPGPGLVGSCGCSASSDNLAWACILFALGALRRPRPPRRRPV